MLTLQFKHGIIFQILLWDLFVENGVLKITYSIAFNEKDVIIIYKIEMENYTTLISMRQCFPYIVHTFIFDVTQRKIKVKA